MIQFTAGLFVQPKGFQHVLPISLHFCDSQQVGAGDLSPHEAPAEPPRGESDPGDSKPTLGLESSKYKDLPFKFLKGSALMGNKNQRPEPDQANKMCFSFTQNPMQLLSCSTKYSADKEGAPSKINSRLFQKEWSLEAECTADTTALAQRDQCNWTAIAPLGRQVDCT